VGAQENGTRMNVITEFYEWFTDPVNWSGEFGIPARLSEHIQLSVVSVVLAAAVALPVGLYIGHSRKAEFLAVSIANLGRAIPSFAILALVFPFAIQIGLGFTFWPTFVALFFLAIPPILTNAYVGVKEVDADTLESARGMGLSEGQILRQIEVPLAAPLIVSGIRTSAVQVVATATLGAVIAWGGLGRFIIDGFKQQNDGMLLGGAVLVAVLAILTEIGLGFVERAVSPGSKRRAILRVKESSYVQPTDPSVGQPT
jgi:osmoprotectant transport system permease protein